MSLFWTIFDIPPITRTYLIGCVIATGLTSLDYLTPFHFIYNITLIFNGQVYHYLLLYLLLALAIVLICILYWRIWHLVDLSII